MVCFLCTDRHDESYAYIESGLTCAQSEGIAVHHDVVIVRYI